MDEISEQSGTTKEWDEAMLKFGWQPVFVKVSRSIPDSDNLCPRIGFAAKGKLMQVRLADAVYDQIEHALLNLQEAVRGN